MCSSKYKSDEEKAQKLISNSGNNFHCKVNNFLRDYGWATQVSPYYLDASSNKAREIDLIAEQEFKYNYNRGDRRNQGRVILRLFIECKYTENINVFWFDDQDSNSTKYLIEEKTGINKNTYHVHNHHYINTENKIAKLFSSSRSQNGENEPIYKALNQSLHAMVYLSDQPSIIKNSSRVETKTIDLPIIVFNTFDRFYKTDISDASNKKEKITDNFQLEVNYAYTDQRGCAYNKYFIIDLVSIEKLSTFLETIINEAEIVKRSLSGHR